MLDNVGKVQAAGPRTPETTADTAPGFGNMLEKVLGDVNQEHIAAEQAVADLVAGKSQDVHNVMIATQKADIGFQLLMQVRNKVVGAYEAIMRMQI
jgi:flagellar hook-basal body complex protein FliE